MNYYDDYSDSENQSEDYRKDLSAEELNAMKVQGFCEDKYESALEALHNGEELQSMRFYLKYATLETGKEFLCLMEYGYRLVKIGLFFWGNDHINQTDL